MVACTSCTRARWAAMTAAGWEAVAETSEGSSWDTAGEMAEDGLGCN